MKIQNYQLDAPTTPAQLLLSPEHVCELLHPVSAALPEAGPGPFPHGQHPGIGQLLTCGLLIGQLSPGVQAAGELLQPRDQHQELHQVLRGHPGLLAGQLMQLPGPLVLGHARA